jgi:hypothetical protein
MKTIDDININQWFMERAQTYVPLHFVVSKTMLTVDALQWIIDKLEGRYAVMNIGIGYPAFEDPKEALFYELKWA